MLQNKETTGNQQSAPECFEEAKLAQKGEEITKDLLDRSITTGN